MKHQSYYETFQATQACEVSELRRCLEAHGGEYNWEKREETMPIICVGTDYYVGDVYVHRAYINCKGRIILDAAEKENDALLVIETDEVMFGHIDYIMDYMEEILTEHEKELVSQAACDLESGNYLLRKRTEEQLTMIKEVSQAINTREDLRDSRQALLYEEYRLCTDYEYAKSKGRT